MYLLISFLKLFFNSSSADTLNLDAKREMIAPHCSTNISPSNPEVEKFVVHGHLYQYKLVNINYLLYLKQK